MEVLKKLLMEFKERGIPKDLIERDLKIDWMRKKANVFVGIRRAGKTYSVFQSLSRFNFRDVFYINMEDDRIINPNIRHLTELIPTIKETFKTNKQIYLFVDEIQNVEGWEKWAKRIAEDPNI
ncbi:AAA family ATPase, partial [Candidatus Micrarchaeota archaeon]|nr:AAA family ATPase [Candidatus Micrarchaeota archaeon]